MSQAVLRGRWAPWRARVGVPSPISALTSVDGVPISARDRGRADGRANRAVKRCPTRRGWPPYHGRATRAVKRCPTRRGWPPYHLRAPRASSAHLLSSSWPVLHARPDAADGQGARRRSCELSVMLCARSISPGWFPSSALTFVRRCACVCTLNAPRVWPCRCSCLIEVRAPNSLPLFLSFHCVLSTQKNSFYRVDAPGYSLIQ